MDDIKGNIEEEITWLEEHGYLWDVILYVSLLGLIGLNSYIHSDGANGLLYFIIVVLISLLSRNITESFFGAAQLAVYIILHISFFGLSPFSLILTLVLFGIFIKQFQKKSIIPISIYLIVDSIVSISNLDCFLTNKFDTWGDIIFSHPFFYAAASFIPLFYAYLKYERYIRNYFDNPFLKRFATFLILGFIQMVLLPIALISKDIFSASILAAIMLIYLAGMLMRGSQERRSNEHSLMMSGLFIRCGILILIIVEMLLLNFWITN